MVDFTGLAILTFVFAYLASQTTFSKAFRLLFLYNALFIGLTQVLLDSVPYLGLLFIVDFILITAMTLLGFLSILTSLGEK